SPAAATDSYIKPAVPVIMVEGPRAVFVRCGVVDSPGADHAFCPLACPRRCGRGRLCLGGTGAESKPEQSKTSVTKHANPSRPDRREAITFTRLRHTRTGHGSAACWYWLMCAALSRPRRSNLLRIWRLPHRP